MADLDDVVIGNMGHLGRVVVTEYEFDVGGQIEPIKIPVATWEDVPVEELVDDG